MELHTLEAEAQIPAKNEIISLAGNFREVPKFKKTSPFIEANSEEVSLLHLKQDCIVPVFTRDCEITISHQEFIETSFAGISKLFPNEVIDVPEIRTSHLIRGRTPDALHVPAKELLENQKTMYYERMAFIIRIPSITEIINGNELALTIGGVRSYNLENLYNKKTFEKFKFFIGFQNMVCCNLCVSTDGYMNEIKATSSHELLVKIMEVVQSYNIHQQIKSMHELVDYKLTEKQFAQIIGKSRLYNYLPKSEKALLPTMLMNDAHISAIAKDYYNDESFCREPNGDINLWNVYNLFTGANKSSYIDTFLERGVNAFTFVKGVSNALSGSNSNYTWFLS